MSREEDPPWLFQLRKEMRRRWVDESLSRLKKCVDQLSEDEIWHRFNENTLTVGNILLHLRGNITQWVISGIGGAPDRRSRDQEFAAAARSASKRDLLFGLESAILESVKIVEQVREEALLQRLQIQGMKETGLSALIHVTEHLSYHTGEVTYITKLLKNIDTKYYDSKKLLTKNSGQSATS